MTPEEILFAGALALPAEDRAAYLQRACGEDGALQERVLALLQGYEGPGAGLEVSPPLVSASSAQSVLAGEPSDYAPGTWIGRYRLLQKIGEGGCGVIFMAEQTAPVRRRVAVKIIKLGMDTKEVIARFEAERQALALMDHPNIAHVLDAGATDAGRPFFVMELVRGIPITHHCDEHKLGTAERLRLFIQICQAVQHAHQKGIIHRDLKPSNILVTLHDGVPVPKIIDFGIAKAMHGRLTDRTLFTAFEQFIGTPAYMSPEQTEMSGLDVDTRSDIYSLGVLLYELLAGRTPFVAQDLVKVGLDEMRRIIRHDEPPRPSTRLVTLDAADRATVARQRGTDVPQLSTLLRGDLDWIVMRAIEKDRTRRYETASSLAADIDRHLRNEPVTARPPNPAYLLQRLIRRHKLAFAAAAGIVTALGLGLVFTLWGLQRERAARQRADLESARSDQVARFMQDMLAGVGPQMALGRDTKMLRAILDETTERLTRELRDQPEVEADLRESLGNVYRDLDELRNAALMHEIALKIRREVFGAEHAKVADSLHQLGDVLARQEKPSEAEAVLREALALREKLLGRTHPLVAATRAALANVQLRRRHQPDTEARPPPGQGSSADSRVRPPAATDAKPPVIRIAHTGGRAAGRTFNAGSIITTARTKRVLEDEFSADGIRVEWTTFPSGPATNEAVSRKLADFATLGAPGAIVGRTAGNGYKQLLRTGANGSGLNYLVVRTNSAFHSLADLKGRRLATIKGTGGHVILWRLLETHGFGEKDFEILNLESGVAVVNSVVAGEADAIVMGRPFDLIAQGVVRVILETEREPDAGGAGALWVTEDFERRYPAVVQRVVNTLVKLAAWNSHEQNRKAVFEAWAQDGLGREEMERNWIAMPLKDRYSPLLDGYYFARQRQSIDEVKRSGIIGPDLEVRVEDWAEPKYLNTALKELNLEGFWPERDAEGKPAGAGPLRPDSGRAGNGSPLTSSDKPAPTTIMPAAGGGLHRSSAPADAKPLVIRVAHAGGRAGAQPYTAGDLLTTVHQLGALEAEFTADGIRIEWTYLSGGPEMNAALSGGLVDFAYRGVAGGILGRAASIKHKMLLRVGVNGNAFSYIVVRDDSPFRSLTDLRGRRFGTILGVGGHLTLCRMLEKGGIGVHEVEFVNLDSAATVLTALAAGETDANVMSRPFDLPTLRKVRVVYDGSRDPDLAGGGAFSVAEEFEKKHPAIVQRVVNVLVKTAAWNSDETSRQAAFALWAKAGQSREEMERNWTAQPLKQRYSPLLDAYYFAELRRYLDDAKRFQIIGPDAEVQVEDWAEPKYLNTALKELKLEDFWLERDVEGKPKSKK